MEKAASVHISCLRLFELLQQLLPYFLTIHDDYTLRPNPKEQHTSLVSISQLEWCAAPALPVSLAITSTSVRSCLSPEVGEKPRLDLSAPAHPHIDMSLAPMIVVAYERFTEQCITAVSQRCLLDHHASYQLVVGCKVRKGYPPCTAQAVTIGCDAFTLQIPGKKTVRRDRPKSKLTSIVVRRPRPCCSTRARTPSQLITCNCHDMPGCERGERKAEHQKRTSTFRSVPAGARLGCSSNQAKQRQEPNSGYSACPSLSSSTHHLLSPPFSSLTS